MLQDYQVLYLDNDIPINRSFYCNNGDIGTRGLEVHVLDNSQAKDCTGLSMKMIVKVPSGEMFEATVANGLVTVLNAATGIYQILFPNNMGKGRLIAEIQLSNTVPEIIVSRKFRILGDGSLTSDGNISVLPGAGILYPIIAAEPARVAAEIVRVANNAQAQEDEAARIAAEAARAGFYGGFSSQLAAIDTAFEEAAANLTIDSEVIVARDGAGSLGLNIQGIKTELAENAKHARKVFNVKGYGAIGDGVADDTQAIKNAIIAIGSTAYATLYFPDAISYKTTDTIDVPVNVNVIMDGDIKYSGVQDRTALKIGSLVNYVYDCEFKLRVISASHTTGNAGYIGIEMINAYSCRIAIVKSMDFTEGYRAFATDNRGFTMNTTILGRLKNNTINIRVTNIRSGWNNGNDYYGGSLSGVAGVYCEGIRIDSIDGLYKGNNANVFYSPKIELASSGTPVIIENSNNNMILNCRNENNNTTYFAIVKGLSYENLFTFSTIMSGTKIINYSTDARHASSYDPERLVYNSGDLVSKAYKCADGGVVIEGVSFADYTSAAAIEKMPAGKCDIKAGIELLSDVHGLSFFVDTTIEKKIAVEINKVSSAPKVVMFVACYLEDGTQVNNIDLPVLTDDEWGHGRYIKYTNTVVPSAYAGYGLTYKVSSTPETKFVFEFKSEIKKVRIIIVRDTASGNAQIASMKVFGYKKSPQTRVFSGLSDKKYLTNGTNVYRLGIDGAGAITATVV